MTKYMGCPRSLEALLFLSCGRSMAPIKTNGTLNEREWTEVSYFHAWNTTSVRWHPLWATQERARESTPSIALSSVAASILPISSVILSFSSASVWEFVAKPFPFRIPKGRSLALSGPLGCFHTTSISKIKLDYPSAHGNSPFHSFDSTRYYGAKTNIHLSQTPCIRNFDSCSLWMTKFYLFLCVCMRVAGDQNGFRTSGTPCISFVIIIHDTIWTWTRCYNT